MRKIDIFTILILKLPFSWFFAKNIYISNHAMFLWLNQNKVMYILSNLLVLPAAIIPNIDFLSNLSFIASFFLLLNSNKLIIIILSIIFIIKNNSNYRFHLLLKLKGAELAKSDYECVYLYAWCTLLRYFLIGMGVSQIILFF